MNLNDVYWFFNLVLIAPLGATLNLTIDGAFFVARNATFLFDHLYYTRTEVHYVRLYGPYPKPKNGSLGWMEEVIVEQYRYKNSALTPPVFTYTLVDDSFNFRCRHGHNYVDNIVLHRNDPIWDKFNLYRELYTNDLVCQSWVFDTTRSRWVYIRHMGQLAIYTIDEYNILTHLLDYGHKDQISQVESNAFTKTVNRGIHRVEYMEEYAKKFQAFSTQSFPHVTEPIPSERWSGNYSPSGIYSAELKLRSYHIHNTIWPSKQGVKTTWYSNPNIFKKL